MLNTTRDFLPPHRINIGSLSCRADVEGDEHESTRDIVNCAASPRYIGGRGRYTRYSIIISILYPRQPRRARARYIVRVLQ